MAGASAPATIWTKKGVPKLPVLMTSDFRLVVEAVSRTEFLIIVFRRGGSCWIRLRVAGEGWMHDTVCRSVSGTSFVAIAVQCNRVDDDQALDSQLPTFADIHQDQAVGEHSDNQGADQGSKNGSDAADEAGAAQDHGRDGIQLISYAELRTVGQHGASGGHDASQTSWHAREL
jgi:hypothetical protein